MVLTDEAREALVAATIPLYKAVQAEMNAGNVVLAGKLNELLVELYRLALRMDDSLIRYQGTDYVPLPES